MVPKKIIAARILFVLYLVGVACLCFIRFDHIPDVQKSFFGIATDKIVHFCMFAPFPLLAYLSYDHRTDKAWKAILYAFITFCMGMLLAYLTELGQKFLPYRSMDMKDLGADTLALTMSSIIVLLIDLFHLRKK